MKNPRFQTRNLTLILFLFAGAVSLYAQGTAFTYQGRLNDGKKPATGSYDLQFYLRDALVGGGPVGTTNTLIGLEVTKGLFTATLDFGANFPGADRWLEIGVRTNGGGAFTALSPRQKLTPTPYAIAAGNLTGPLPAAQLSGTVASAQLGGLYSASLTLSNPANNFAGSGTGLTGVNAVTLGGLAPSTFWQLGGNAGTSAGVNFLGTTDNQPLELKVNGQRAFRLEPTTDSPNVIGGFSGNYADAGVIGATISGGGESNAPNAIQIDFNVSSPTRMYDTIGGGSGNVFLDSFYSTIGGGFDNSMYIGSFDTIAGGNNNHVGITGLGPGAANSIGGGLENSIHGAYGCGIVGGVFNDIIEASPSSIGGGANNFIAISDYAAIGGGFGNRIAISGSATIGGGYQNTSWGNDSTIGGGAGNGIGGSGTGAVVGGGSHNGAHSSYATIGGGTGNQVYAGNATIAGGSGNSIESVLDFEFAFDPVGATVGGGQSNLVNIPYGTIPGGVQAVAQNYGQMAYASGQFANPGDAQTSVMVCRGATTSDTTTELYLDGISERMVLATNSSWGFDIMVTGRAASGDTAAYQFFGAAENIAGVTSLPVPPKKTIVAADSASWDVNMSAPGTNGALIIKVNGQAATPIRWVATVRTVEVTY